MLGRPNRVLGGGGGGVTGTNEPVHPNRTSKKQRANHKPNSFPSVVVAVVWKLSVNVNPVFFLLAGLKLDLYRGKRKFDVCVFCFLLLSFTHFGTRKRCTGGVFCYEDCIHVSRHKGPSPCPRIHPGVTFLAEGDAEISFILFFCT